MIVVEQRVSIKLVRSTSTDNLVVKLKKTSN